MTAWPVMTLGEVCAEGGGFIRTGPFGSQLHQSDYVDDPNGVPVVMPKDMAHGRVDRSSIARIGPDTAGRLSQHLLEPGDIALSRRGDVGRSAWIGPDDLPVLCGTGSMRVHPGRPRSVDPDYLRYFFRSRLAIDYLEGQAVGATMPNLNAEIVTGLPVPVLPLDLQRSAARILRTIDDLIENNRRRVDLLEEMARVTYREWFVRFRYPGHTDVPLVDSAHGPVPAGWTASRLRDLVTTQYGYTESATTDPIGPHFLRGMDINKRSYIDWSTVPYCAIDEGERRKYEVQQGDVFVIRMADPGKVSICEVDVDAVFASYLVRLRPRDERIDSYFLFFTLGDEAYQGWVTGASSGATRKSVSAKVMTEPFVVVPSLGHQAHFRGRVQPLREELNALVDQNSRLTAIRDLLLPKLVSGAVDLSRLDLEPVGATA